uniref:Uncharacterized protein n=1 Tax=Setaria italica TaxID=4555 RepID=K3YFI5_SETIT
MIYSLFSSPCLSAITSKHRKCLNKNISAVPTSIGIPILSLALIIETIHLKASHNNISMPAC